MEREKGGEKGEREILKEKDTKGGKKEKRGSKTALEIEQEYKKANFTSK